MAVELLDFTIEFDETDSQRRRGYRVHFPGLTVWIPDRKTCYSVIDLSTFGVCFRDEEKKFSLGQQMLLDINVQGKIWVAGLKAKIVGIRDEALVACNFEELSEPQEIKMDKLSLEIQKRWIEHRKRQKQQQGEDEQNSNHS
ncbi:PilZ domain-containing protein [Desulfonatronum thiosulfatophilum]|uniref:PilZ domain-containing protein n=1 Tax=Desulfonatronum thiosulfatophilum TaxID=617002 RepID=A0A1G6D200_9BACT|nr:PilZ domain-containing protein [Desulfonatronum thiosulfatophilum]SDB39202.1 PilZ domain-containing protein [Desulfonatronum thiosulfatophilum]